MSELMVLSLCFYFFLCNTAWVLAMPTSQPVTVAVENRLEEVKFWAEPLHKKFPMVFVLFSFFSFSFNFHMHTITAQLNSCCVCLGSGGGGGGSISIFFLFSTLLTTVMISSPFICSDATNHLGTGPLFSL